MIRQGVPARTGHPPPEYFRPPRVLLPVIVLVLAAAVLLGIFLYYAQFSGTVRWILGIVALGVLAVFAWGTIRRRTTDLAPLVAPPAPAVVRDGDLETFAAAVRRASRGLPYSQALVAARVRSAFAERARLAFGVPPERMREVQRDPTALRQVFDDDLAEFLRTEVADSNERLDWVRTARERGFVRALNGILDRMEAWR